MGGFSVQGLRVLGKRLGLIFLAFPSIANSMILSMLWFLLSFTLYLLFTCQVVLVLFGSLSLSLLLPLYTDFAI